MSAVAYYVILCDRCGVDFETSLANAAHARREAATDGWTRPVNNPQRSRMRIDACPTCSKEN